MNVQQQLQQIDPDIARQAPTRVGVKMGPSLYCELRKSGHITDEDFGVSGTDIWNHKWPAYRKEHAASMDPEMADDAFTVGEARP